MSNLKPVSERAPKQRAMTLEEIKARVKVHGPNGCWELRKPDGGEYKSCPSIARSPNTLTIMAYVLLLNGTPVPEGQMALRSHSCTYKWCCNPDHLRPGTIEQRVRRVINPNSIAPGRHKNTDWSKAKRSPYVRDGVTIDPRPRRK